MLLTSSLLLDFVILLLSILFGAHLYVSKKYKYWEKRGVVSPKTKPFVGNFLDVVLLRTTAAEWMKSYYDKIHKDFFGVYIFDSPYLVVKNPALIKQILIKDFSHFTDRNIAAPDHSPIMANMLFLQKSPGWKTGRSKLTVTFTSGKMKAMFPLLVASADLLIEFLEKNQTVLESKDLAARFTTDIISKCAFGINSRSFDETESTFTTFRKKMFGFSIRNAFAQSVYFFKPIWAHLFKLEFIEKKLVSYYIQAFKEAMNSRTTTNKRFNDLIDILIDLKKNKIMESNGDDEVFCYGSAIQFFVGGFETTSASISFTLYACAMKPEIQEAMREEMLSVIEKHGGITYEALQDMTYVEMCIDETLRMYPALPFLDRCCNEDYKIPNTDVTIEKGISVLIPMYGLHMDETLFPDPYNYNPERFRNKLDNSNGIYYVPFGAGPRNCIGERFGRLGTKLALVYILTKFEVTKVKTTPDPVIFDPRSFLFISNVGLPMKFTKLSS